MRNAIVNAAGFPVGGADETPTIPALAGCTPAFSAPDIWPQLFGQ